MLSKEIELKKFMPPFSFTIDAECPDSWARAGTILTPHGTISDAYFYARGDAGDGEKCFARRTAGGGRADYPREYLSSDVATWLGTDR